LRPGSSQVFRCLLIIPLALIAIATHTAAQTGSIYWTDQGVGQIRQANLDGASVHDLLARTALGIALDVVGGKMYWTNTGAKKIQRATLDATSSKTLLPVA